MPVGGSVDEGVVILLVLRGAMSERPRAPAVCICAAAAWGCPRVLCPSGRLSSRVRCAGLARAALASVQDH